MKKVIGLLIIVFGVFLEITWLGICFGSVIIGVILLIFAPRVLFFPFNFFLLIGLSVMKGVSYHQTNNFKYQNYSNQQNSYTQPQNDLDKYYKVLESEKTDSLDVIKKRYRTLMKEYHYDSIISKNLPEDMIKYAEQKTKDLNEAYSAIKKARS